MGRPAFRPTPKQRADVATLKAGGMTDELIATALRITAKTLRKAFREELTQGAADKRADVLKWMMAAAKKGNVAAQKELLRRADLAMAEEAFLKGRDAPATVAARLAKPPKPGKKEQAAIDAETAASGTDWGDDLDPLVVN